ncbi:hypothetical protein [Devosia epidermidihirudinis]|nr:hypothetical protein [Devosia epidermidihirudinis]
MPALRPIAAGSTAAYETLNVSGDSWLPCLFDLLQVVGRYALDQMRVDR